MRNKFDEQLAVLNAELINMGALCEDAISHAASALAEYDKAKIEKVYAVDSEIDQKERDIENLCMKLLLQQQPVASDLRTISSALKMISDMERIGDQSSDIADIARYIKNNQTKSKVHINDMATAAIKMVTTSIDSFVKRDLDMVAQVFKDDDKVDGLFLQVKDELTQLITHDNAANGELCLDLLMAAKYFERIGDHAENIAEWVEYSITGTYKGANQ
ncbi:MAG: phosphate signaling complex protein PhoU [Oscillospiraceae bacterium]